MDYVLYHHGVKGQKWGVRRYQKKDGSLTRLGKKRLQEGARIFPTYKGKPLRYKSELSKNRDTVYEKVANDVGNDTRRKYEEFKKTNPSFGKDDPSESDSISRWNAHVRDKREAEATRNAYAKRFIEEYGDATLADLGISANAETRKYVQDLIKSRSLSDAIVGPGDNDSQSVSSSKESRKINATEKKPESSRKTSVNNVSTDELKARTDRLNAEKNYFDAERGRKEAYDKAYPKPAVKVQENFAKKFFNDAVKPALVDVGKKQIENYLNTEIEKLTKGKADKNSIEYLRKANEKQDLKAKIADNTQKEMKSKHKIEKYRRGEWD